MYYKILHNGLICFCFLLLLFASVESVAQVQEDSLPVTDTAAKKAPLILKKIVEIMEDKIEKEKKKSSAQDMVIDGLIIDETRTKMGRDFYDIFFSNWDAPEGARNFTLTIKELPGRATSSFISIEVNDQEILELPLQPRYDVIEEMAQYAVARCYEYFANYEQIQKDLSSGDLSGTGIY